MGKMYGNSSKGMKGGKNPKGFVETPASMVTKKGPVKK